MSIFEEYGAFKVEWSFFQVVLIVEFDYYFIWSLPMLTLTTLQTGTDTYANCVDPKEWSQVSSGSTLFAILFSFLTETPLWNNGYGQIQRWKSLLQNLRDERVNHYCNNLPMVVASSALLS